MFTDRLGKAVFDAVTRDGRRPVAIHLTHADLMALRMDADFNRSQTQRQHAPLTFMDIPIVEDAKGPSRLELAPRERGGGDTAREIAE